MSTFAGRSRAKILGTNYNWPGILKHQTRTTGYLDRHGLPAGLPAELPIVTCKGFFTAAAPFGAQPPLLFVITTRRVARSLRCNPPPQPMNCASRRFRQRNIQALEPLPGRQLAELPEFKHCPTSLPKMPFKLFPGGGARRAPTPSLESLLGYQRQNALLSTWTVICWWAPMGPPPSNNQCERPLSAPPATHNCYRNQPPRPVCALTNPRREATCFGRRK